MGNSMSETRTLEDCIGDAKETLVENLEGQENYLRRHGADDIVSDSIYECADGAVPTYTGDIIEVFGSDGCLWYETPDNDCKSVIDTISRVIYEALVAALYEYANDLQGDDIVCEEGGCDEEDDHELPADENPRCKLHCGGLDSCEDCQEADVEDTEVAFANAQDANLRAEDAKNN